MDWSERAGRCCSFQRGLIASMNPQTELGKFTTRLPCTGGCWECVGGFHNEDNSIVSLETPLFGATMGGRSFIYYFEASRFRVRISYASSLAYHINLHSSLPTLHSSELFIEPKEIRHIFPEELRVLQPNPKCAMEIVSHFQMCERHMEICYDKDLVLDCVGPWLAQKNVRTTVQADGGREFCFDRQRLDREASEALGRLTLNRK